ncbi:MAG: NAD(P)-dependent dehydrogenase (short-subunit alcohol dehydrogenase family) [Patiriisocius sp.]|jgi:NAD(P)-dependent dehydrogenase (short-subunit alcohol dehydrogenase family)
MGTFDMKGKHVAITGASSGFGHHFAGVLANAGAKVSLGARRLEKIDERVKEINAAGGQAKGFTLDVTDAASAAAFLDEAEQAQGTIDVLVNNAGVEAGAKTYAMIDDDDWDYVMDTNLKSVWRLSKLFSIRVGADKARSGSIINIASITAFRTIKGQFPYAVSKAALIKATEIMALEGAKFGVRVNALAPGYILTDVSRVLLESERSESFVKGIPMRRYGEFEDLDGPLLLLASDGSSYMTGTTLVVDGGHVVSELA